MNCMFLSTEVKESGTYGTLFRITLYSKGSSPKLFVAEIVTYLYIGNYI